MPKSLIVGENCELRIKLDGWYTLEDLSKLIKKYSTVKGMYVR